MGSEEVWEMRETVIEDVTPMLEKDEKSEVTPAGTPNSTRRGTRVTINDARTHETRGRSVSLPARDPRFIDWDRRRSSAIAELHEEEIREMSRWRAFNHNRYARKKTAAQGMMDMALMLANASQLKSVVQEGPSHEHYLLLLSLISVSIALQIFTGLVLLVVGARESKCEDHQDEKNEKTNKLNNFSIALVFVITVTNIFITSFGINGNTSLLSASGSGSGVSDDGAFGRGSGTSGGVVPFNGT